MEPVWPMLLMVLAMRHSFLPSPVTLCLLCVTAWTGVPAHVAWLACLLALVLSCSATSPNGLLFCK